MVESVVVSFPSSSVGFLGFHPCIHALVFIQKTFCDLLLFCGMSLVLFSWIYGLYKNGLPIFNKQGNNVCHHNTSKMIYHRGGEPELACIVAPCMMTNHLL